MSIPRHTDEPIPFDPSDFLVTVRDGQIIVFTSDVPNFKCDTIISVIENAGHAIPNGEIMVASPEFVAVHAFNEAGAYLGTKRSPRTDMWARLRPIVDESSHPPQPTANAGITIGQLFDWNRLWSNALDYKRWRADTWTAVVLVATVVALGIACLIKLA